MVSIDRLTGSFIGMPVACGGNALLTTAANPASVHFPHQFKDHVEEMTTLGGVNGTICDAQQYQQSLLSLTSVNPSISCLTHGQTIGLALTAEASFISLICVLIIFILIARNILRYRKAPQKADRKLLQAPADIYMFSLFIFDIIQAMGGILNVRWAGNGQVTTGSYCMAQGIIKQIGGLGTSLITIILAVHTFITALWGIGINARGFAFRIIGLVCVFIALWVGIGNGVNKSYEAPSPYWCWISPRFPGQRLAGEYIWFWIALFASVVMYIPLYLWAEGRLSIGDKWYKFHLSQPDPNVEYAQRQTSLGMLFYPLAYSLVVLPLSVARWSLDNHKDVPSAALFFGQFMFNLSGAINVLLFLTIRPQLLLFAPPPKAPEPDAEIPHLNTGPVIILRAVQREHAPGMTGRPVDDMEKRPRKFTVVGSRNSEEPPRVGSRQRLDDI